MKGKSPFDLADSEVRRFICDSECKGYKASEACWDNVCQSLFAGGDRIKHAQGQATAAALYRKAACDIESCMKDLKPQRPLPNEWLLRPGK